MHVVQFACERQAIGDEPALCGTDRLPTQHVQALDLPGSLNLHGNRQVEVSEPAKMNLQGRQLVDIQSPPIDSGVVWRIAPKAS